MTSVTVLILSIVFWGCVFLIGHTYAFYPMLLKLLVRGKELPGERFKDDDAFPEVAVLMAVYNEEAVLETTLRSILSSGYPSGKMRVFIGSDGSTDQSEPIVRRFQAEYPELHLTVFGGRNGKIRIINQLAVEATLGFRDPTSGIFVLCDANVSWAPDAVKNLTRHFVRPQVGLVGAAVKDRVKEHVGIGDEEEAYIGQENLVKYQEGVLWGKVMGAFGACYAMRASLFSPVPEHYIVDDFYLTLSVLEKGSDAIVDLDATCFEAVSTDIREEFRRKKRIATGNFQNFAHFWKWLQPWNSDFAISFAFWSHKGLRWCGPFLLAGAFFSCLLLAILQPLYLLPLAGFMGTFFVALLDHYMTKHVKLFRFVRYFYSMNAALLCGCITFLKGVKNSVWEPTRREGITVEAGPNSARKPAPNPALLPSK